MSLSLTLLCSLILFQGERDTNQSLRDLGAPRAEVRAEAERWLAAHLEPASFPQVAEAARVGGPELRRRLAAALGANDRHLELVALLLTDREADVQHVGSEALRDQLLRWSTSAADAPQPAGKVPTPWLEKEDEVLEVDLSSETLGVLVDRLARLGRPRAAIVLDPRLDPGVRRPVGEPPRGAQLVRGSWLEVLDACVRRHRVVYQVHGWREEGSQDARGAREWIRVLPEEDAESSGGEVLEGWVRGVLREFDPTWNTACARALAASEWPAALLWLERRWVERGELAALEGLLTAAAGGRVAPSLADPARVRALLDEVDRRILAREAGARDFAERVARALGALGPRSVRGASLASELWSGEVPDQPVSHWVRHVAAEGMGVDQGGVADRALAELARESPAQVRLAALMALVRVTGSRPRDPVVPAAPSLLRHARELGRLSECARALASVGARPEQGVPAPDQPELRAAWAEWMFFRGDLDAAAVSLLPLPTDVIALTRLSQRLRRWRGLGLGADVGRLFESLRTSRDAGVARLALWSGEATAAERAAAIATAAGTNLPAPAERAAWIDLASLAADAEHGERAREALIEAVRGEGEGPPILALERAFLELRRARQDRRFERLRMDLLRGLASRGGEDELVRALFQNDWPPNPGSGPRVLAAEDRQLTDS